MTCIYNEGAAGTSLLDGHNVSINVCVWALWRGFDTESWERIQQTPTSWVWSQTFASFTFPTFSLKQPFRLLDPQKCRPHHHDNIIWTCPGGKEAFVQIVLWKSPVSRGKLEFLQSECSVSHMLQLWVLISKLKVPAQIMLLLEAARPARSQDSTRFQPCSRDGIAKSLPFDTSSLSSHCLHRLILQPYNRVSSYTWLNI